MSAPSQTATVTWTDPVVGAGQAALATLTIWAALSRGDPAPVQLGTAAPGAQTFTGPVSSLQSGQSYYVYVTATDVNNQVSQQSNWAGPLGPMGAPSPPTNVQAALS